MTKITKFLLTTFLLLASTYAFAGSINAIPPMEPVNDSAALLKPEPGKALIIFTQPRTTCLGRTYRADVYSLTPWNPAQPALLVDRNFLGYLYAHSRISYQARPGKYTFMVAGSDADFLPATVEADKTYYVNVEYAQCIGDGAGIFRFKPLNAKSSQKDIHKLMQTTYGQKLTPQQLAWFKQHVNDVLQAENYNQSRWQQSTNKVMLKATDGV